MEEWRPLVTGGGYNHNVITTIGIGVTLARHRNLLSPDHATSLPFRWTILMVFIAIALKNYFLFHYELADDIEIEPSGT